MSGPTTFAPRPPNPFSMPAFSSAGASTSPHAFGHNASGSTAAGAGVGAAAAAAEAGAEAATATAERAPAADAHPATTSSYEAATALEHASHIDTLLAEPVRFVRKDDSKAKHTGSEAERLGYTPCNRPGFALAPAAAQPVSSPAPDMLASPSKYPNTPTSSLTALASSQTAPTSTGGSSSRTVPLSRATSPSPSSATERTSPLTPRTNLQIAPPAASPAARPASASASKAAISTEQPPQSPAPAASANDASQKPAPSDLFRYPIPMAFPRDTVQQEVDPIGLRNHGNTCYQNSVMQALLHTAPLTNLFLTRSPDELRGRAGVAPAGFCTIEATQSFVRRVLIERHLTAPSELNRNLKLFARPLRIGRQEDAHEFLRFLLEGMQRVCLVKAPNKLKPSNPLTSTTFVHKIFGGRLRSRVHCLSCGYDSDTFDPFLDLSLDLRAGNFGGFGSAAALESITASLAAFTRVEKLDGKNKYRCEQCKKLTAAQKQFSLDRVPPILTIQLKRFTLTGQKNGSPIKFPETLKLGQFMSANSLGGNGPKKAPGQQQQGGGLGQDDVNPTYRLYAVVHHFGGGPNSGHYVATVRRGNKWYRCDDSSTYSTRSPCGDPSAYILFYQREGMSMIDVLNGPLASRKASMGCAGASNGGPQVGGTSPLKRRESMPPPMSNGQGSPAKVRRLSVGPPSAPTPRTLAPTPSAEAAPASGFRPRFSNPPDASSATPGPSKARKDGAMSSLLQRAQNTSEAASASGGPPTSGRSDGDDLGERVDDGPARASIASVVDEADNDGIVPPERRKRKRQLLPLDDDEGEDDPTPDGRGGATGDASGDSLRDIVFKKKKAKKSRLGGVVPRAPGVPGDPTAADRSTSAPSFAFGGQDSPSKKSKKERRKEKRQLQQQQHGGGGSSATFSPYHNAGGAFGRPGLGGPLLGQRPGAKRPGKAAAMAPRSTPRY